MLVGCRYNQFFLSHIFFVLGSLFFVSQTCNSVIYNARGINKHIRTTQTATGWKSTSYQYFTKLHSACARNAWQILCLTNIRSSFFGWVRCFHVWSRPVLWLRFCGWGFVYLFRFSSVFSLVCLTRLFFGCVVVLLADKF